MIAFPISARLVVRTLGSACAILFSAVFIRALPISARSDVSTHGFACICVGTLGTDTCGVVSGTLGSDVAFSCSVLARFPVRLSISSCIFFCAQIPSCDLIALRRGD